MKRFSFPMAALLSMASLLICRLRCKKVTRSRGSSATKVEHAVKMQRLAGRSSGTISTLTDRAVEYVSTSQLVVTGSVSPDISRTVPVISIATGRVVEIKARLGDTVKKGQLLLRVQSADIAGAFSDYRKAVADEQLSHTQLERAKLLYGKGAISLNDLQVAQDTEDKAKVDVENTSEKLHVLGGTTSNTLRASWIFALRFPASSPINKSLTRLALRDSLRPTRSPSPIFPRLDSLRRL